MSKETKETNNERNEFSFNRQYAMLLPRLNSTINYPNWGRENGILIVSDEDLRSLTSKHLDGKVHEKGEKPSNKEYAPWRILIVPSKELADHDGLPEEDPVDWVFRQFIWGGCALEEVPQGSAVSTANFQADIIANLRLARKIASRYFKLGTGKFDPHNQELIMGGIEGLIHARKAWSPACGIPFRKFAVWHVKTGVQNVLSLERPIVVPNKGRLRLAKVAKAISLLIAEGKIRDEITADMINQRYYRDTDAEPTEEFSIGFKATTDLVVGVHGYSMDELPQEKAGEAEAGEAEAGDFFQSHLPDPLRGAIEDEKRATVRAVVAKISEGKPKSWIEMGFEALIGDKISYERLGEQYGVSGATAWRHVEEFKELFKEAWNEMNR